MEPFLHKENPIVLVDACVHGAEHSEAKCDPRLLASEPGETAAAVEISLPPAGQSFAFQWAYGL